MLRRKGADLRFGTSDIRLQMSDGIEAVDFSVIGEKQHGGVGFLDCARNDRDGRGLRKEN